MTNGSKPGDHPKRPQRSKLTRKNPTRKTSGSSGSRGAASGEAKKRPAKRGRRLPGGDPGRQGVGVTPEGLRHAADGGSVGG